MDKMSAPSPKGVASARAVESPNTKGEVRLRVHDHDDHIFEPSPAPVAKPKPFKPTKHRHLPIAVPVLMVGNILVFILMMYSNNCPAHIPSGEACVASWLKPLSFQPWAENPMLGPRASTLLRWGGLESDRVTRHKQAWRLLSSIALNGGVLQLCFNLLVLLIVGTRLESAFRFVKLVPLYIISAFGGNVLSALFIQTQVFASAGAAICGLIAGNFADLALNWSVSTRKLFKLFSLFSSLLIALAFGLMPQVDNFANAGGLVTGFLLGLVLLKRPQKGYKDTRHLSQLEAFIVNSEHEDQPPVQMYKLSQRIASWIAFVILVGLLASGTLILLLDRFRVNKSCSWCHYAACVPNLKWDCPGVYATP